MGTYSALMKKIHDQVQNLEREGRLEKMFQEKTDASKGQNATQSDQNQHATA